MKKQQLYSGWYTLPAGKASDNVTPGCLVLEGGAFRGLYTSGVLDAFMEADINLQCTVGVSAGALNGMYYTAGQIGRSARINLRYRHDPRYVGLQAVRRNRGLIGFDFVFGHLDDVPDFDMERFSAPERDFYAVATNVHTAQPEFFGKDLGREIFQAVQASASMPYVSKPVPLRQRQYLDGGCSLNIPYRWAIDKGFEKIVVIKTQHPDYRKPLTEHSLRGHTPEEIYQNDYPDLADALRGANARYNRECEELEALAESGRVFVIAPSEPVNVTRLETDMEKLGRLYYLGYEDGKRETARLQEYLKGQQNEGT